MKSFKFFPINSCSISIFYRPNLIRRIRAVSIVSAILFVSGTFVLDGEYTSLRAAEELRITKGDLSRWRVLDKRDGKEERKIYRRLIAQKAAELTNGLNTDREKAIALSSWIAANWRNASEDPVIHASHNSPSKLAKFINRTGACGTRTSIFVSLARAAGLKVSRYSIFNFGKVGAGHTAAQVFWGGKWHYFDVTYSGYFEKDGDILSFDEIAALPGSAQKYLVPFKSFGDVYGRKLPKSEWRLVDNTQRMNKIYSPKRLAKSSAKGFANDPTPITLKFAMKPGDSLGAIDNSYNDVFKDERAEKKSEQLERMGFTSSLFFQHIDLQALQLGQTYRYQIDISKSELDEDSVFKASSQNCEIMAGQEFTQNSRHWAIDVKAQSDHCTLDITHNILTRRRFMEVDKLEFRKLKSPDLN